MLIMVKAKMKAKAKATISKVMSKGKKMMQTSKAKFVQKIASLKQRIKSKSATAKSKPSSSSKPLAVVHKDKAKAKAKVVASGKRQGTARSKGKAQPAKKAPAMKLKAKGAGVVKKTATVNAVKVKAKVVGKGMPTKKPVEPVMRAGGKASKAPSMTKPYVLKKGEEYMNVEQLEHFKNILLQWKNDLLQGAETTVHDMQATAANFPDPVDRATQEEEFNLELRARDRERKLLKKIEETLQRIRENNYGYCDDCSAEIGVRRLEVRPTATQCIECKTIAEIREKQIGDVGKDRDEEI
jgi:DnaK suppressor protein